ncbi:MAG: cytochrome c biogenesis protein CcdA [Armatimonadota bacterium]
MKYCELQNAFFAIAASYLILTCATALAGEQIVAGRIVVSRNALRPGDIFELAFVGHVKPGYHIGAANNSSLYPAKLSIKAPDEIIIHKIVYPKPKKLPSLGGERISVYEGRFIIRAIGNLKDTAQPGGTILLAAQFESQGCKKDLCFPPEVVTYSVSVPVVAKHFKTKPANTNIFGTPLKTGKSSSEQEFAENLAKRGLFLKLLMLYAFGLLLAFTPCVYPMIPVTIGYFSSQSESRTGRVIALAAVYVLGIALTYSVLGTFAATTGSVFGEVMQNHWVLAGIAAILVVLALSMFGLYEIRPPAFITERASGRTGILGALVMGLIFGIVAAPCVGPAVLGLMLYVAKLGKPAIGFMLFFALSLGIGTPLFFLAAFSAKLPTAGMWMVAIRKIAGFLLLGAAAYFAKPIAPQAVRDYLIPLIVAGAGIYFAVFERSLLTSRPLAFVSKLMGILAITVAVFVAIQATNTRQRIKWEPYSEEALTQAAHDGIPIMVDFTAEWCAACKELEHKTFVDPKVVRESKRFRRLRVDATNRSDPDVASTISRHSVKGFPTVVFFDSTGREVPHARVMGFVEPDEFLKRMRSVR